MFFKKSLLILLTILASMTCAIVAFPSEAEASSKTRTYSVSEDELRLMANIVYQEARGESYEGQVAVAEVIMNRVASDMYPDTITEVVSQDGQFSSYSSARSMSEDETSEEILEICRGVINGSIDVLDNSNVVAFKRNDGSDTFCGTVLYQVIDNHAFYEKV